MPSIIQIFTYCPGSKPPAPPTPHTHPPAPGNETRPSKVRVMRFSCLEVQCHSWIGFASKPYFARRADIHGCTVGARGHPRTLVQAPLLFEQCSSSCSCSHSCIQKYTTLKISLNIKTVAPGLHIPFGFKAFVCPSLRSIRSTSKTTNKSLVIDLTISFFINVSAN